MTTGAVSLRSPALARASSAPRVGLGVLAAGCTALALLSLVLPTTPTYDPYAWLIWGREIGDLELNTRNGPSWKPLPVMFTTVFGFVPSAAPDLWVAVARAGLLLSLVLAFRVARRLGGGWVGGALAVAVVALTDGVLRFGAVGDSEGVLVALLLVAVDLHLDGRHRAALWACLGAALLRPESWAFVGLYALWVARRDPGARQRVAAMAVGTLALWFGPELIGSGDALRAGNRARDPNPNALAFAPSPALAVLERAWHMLPTLGVLGLLAVPVVARRAGSVGRVLTALTLAGLAWLGLVMVMTEGGFSGNARYLIAPLALLSVAGSAALGALLARVGRRPAVAALLAAALLAPFAVVRVPNVVTAAEKVDNEARLMSDLSRAVALVGGADAVRACGGQIVTGPFQVTALAWRLDVPIERLDYGAATRPGTVFIGIPFQTYAPGAPRFPVRTGGSLQADARAWRVHSTCALRS